jgi:hypothetical protein
VPIIQGDTDPYDTLATFFEQHVDMAAILALLKGSEELRETSRIS